jgi:anti-sigma B factor antagonist
MANFAIERKDNNEVTVLHANGYLDAHTAPEFENALSTLLQENRFKIVVSLEGLQYISSAGLGVFMGFIEEVRQHEGDIKITQVSPRVFKVFDLLGFPSLYEFYDSTDDAIAKFKY